MLIRPEVPSDFSEVYRFVKKAFASAYVKDGSEQDFVEKLRAGAGYLPDLALVAEEAGRLVGYVMLTRIFAVEGTTRFPLLLLAPLAIAEEERNRGKGAFLAEKALHGRQNWEKRLSFWLGILIFTIVWVFPNLAVSV